MTQEQPQAFIPIMFSPNGTPTQLPDNAVGTERTLIELAAECERNGQNDIGDYLLSKAMEAESNGGQAGLHVPGLNSPSGYTYELEDSLIKSLAINSMSPSPTPHKFNESLYLLGGYNGIVDPAQMTQWTFSVLRSAVNNIYTGGIFYYVANKATRYTKKPRHAKDKGFEIGMRDRRAKVTRAVAKKIDEITDLILHGGYYREPNGRLRTHPETGQPGVWDGNGEDRAVNFCDFTKAMIIDSLSMDWACFRKEPGSDKKKYPVVFFTPVDSQMIRRANPKAYKPAIVKTEKYVQFVEYAPGYSGQIAREFPWYRMGTMVRNPRFDFFTKGYGHSETEIVLDVLSAMVLGLRFSREYYDNNHIPPMIVSMMAGAKPMSLKGSAALRSAILQTGGPGAFWKALFLQFPPGTQGNPVQSTPLRSQIGGQAEINGAMQLMAFLYTLLCSLYPVMPEELGVESFTVLRQSLNQASNQPEFQKGDDKFRALMEPYAACLNEHIVWLIDPDFELRWVGLEAESEAAELEAGLKKQQLGMTLNQLQDESDKPRVKPPVDPVFYDSIAVKYDRDKFDTYEDWQSKINAVYEKECEKKEYPFAWSQYADVPIGNQQAMMVWQQEQQQLQQAKQEKDMQEHPEKYQQQQQQFGQFPGQGEQPGGGEEELEDKEKPKRDLPPWMQGMDEENEPEEKSKPPMQKGIQGGRVIEVVVQ